MSEIPRLMKVSTGGAPSRPLFRARYPDLSKDVASPHLVGLRRLCLQSGKGDRELDYVTIFENCDRGLPFSVPYTIRKGTSRVVLTVQRIDDKLIIVVVIMARIQIYLNAVVHKNSAVLCPKSGDSPGYLRLYALKNKIDRIRVIDTVHCRGSNRSPAPLFLHFCETAYPLYARPTAIHQIPVNSRRGQYPWDIPLQDVAFHGLVIRRMIGMGKNKVTERGEI